MKTKYEDENTTGNIRVVFLNSDGIRLVRGFESDYLAQKFIRKINRSKKTTLVSVTMGI